jgi:hypothetical protein
MKRTLLTIALLTAFAAAAQTTVDSTSGSQSAAGANSGSVSGVSSANSGNTSVTAVGNQAGSQSSSGSESGAVSGSRSGAMGNVIYLDQSGPTSQTVNATSTANSTSKETADVHYSGGTKSEVVNSGTVVQDIRYSGTQTLKNVPGIAMSGPASGPCTGVSGGIGLAGPGWGVGLNGSSVMDDCRMRENTRVLGMGMQSLDGAANPQEKGEATVMFMDAMRGLAAYNKTLIDKATKESK